MPADASQFGALIAIEGIDGSGKRTQLELLHHALVKEGRPHRLISFPRYESSFFGALVARYLDGEFGDIHAISPYLSSLAFAGDRFQARREMLDELEAGTLVVADRYVGSNLAYQSAKLPPSERESFRKWLEVLEYEVYRVPRPTLSVYFHMPVDRAIVLMRRRERRRQRVRSADSYEKDLPYLSEVSAEFEKLAKSPGWVQINAVDKKGQLHDPLEIHREFLRHLWQCLLPLVSVQTLQSKEAGVRKGDRVILSVDQAAVRSLFTSERFVGPGSKADRIKEVLLRSAVPGRRADIEEDQTRKQLVVCAVLTHGEKYGLFRRSWNGNRSEMQLRWSLLVGGHVDSTDTYEGDPILGAIRRELDEEIVLPEGAELRFGGFVNDDRNTVARTHLCILYWLKLPTPVVRLKKAGAAEYEDNWESPRFVTASELNSLIGRFDPWSEILTKEVIGDRARARS